MKIEEILIGQSSVLKRLRNEIPGLAKLQRHILVKGDPGTGKATVSKLIHAASKSPRPLLTLNPSSDTELEVKETFTKVKAVASSILVQDIGEFSFILQAQISNMIRHLPKKPFTRVFVTAKKGINELQKQGKLIDDLAEILKQFETLTIPSLGQRTEDIPLLVEFFIKNACETIDVKPKAIDINVLDFLVRKEWKENVGELKSVIEKAVFTSQGETIDLPETLVNEYLQLEGMVTNIKEKKQFSFDKSLYNLEKTLIEKTLEAVSDNQTRAAEILNISEANLRYRLKKFHIIPSREK